MWKNQPTFRFRLNMASFNEIVWQSKHYVSRAAGAQQAERRLLPPLRLEWVGSP